MDEGALAVDLDDGQPLPVTCLEFVVARDVDLPEVEQRLPPHLLEHRPRAVAEVAAAGGVENDAGHRDSVRRGSTIAAVDSTEAARAWADVWADAWRAHDVDAIVALYAEDAVFRSAPFREPHSGHAGVRAYVEWAFAEEDAVEVWFGEPVGGRSRAAVEYWAVITSAGGDQTLAGIAVLTFAADGRVTSQRDYWTMEEGRRHPPPGWGT